MGQRHIPPHKGVHAARHHGDGGTSHVTHKGALLAGAAIQEADDLGNVLGLIADALHIRYHFQRRADLPQVAGHRLLLQ